MIKLAFSIINPWARDTEQRTFLVLNKVLTKNWSFELEVQKTSPYHVLGFVIDTSWRGRDHAGPTLELQFMGYEVTIMIYNVNHWNYETGKWEM